jgi:hypothetical protein
VIHCRKKVVVLLQKLPSILNGKNVSHQILFMKKRRPNSKFGPLIEQIAILF